jgi:hypothetical protein
MVVSDWDVRRWQPAGWLPHRMATAPDGARARSGAGWRPSQMPRPMVVASLTTPVAPRRVMSAEPTRIDRLLITATVDRLIFGDPDIFSADDARTLLDALPRKRVPWIEIGAKGKVSGGSTRGFAAGVGDVKVEDDQARKFDVSTSSDAYTRAGQWKLLRYDRRRGTHVEIEQVMADPTDEGRGARLRYRHDGTPLGMDIRVVRNVRLLFSMFILQLPGWRPWTQPA